MLLAHRIDLLLLNTSRATHGLLVLLIVPILQAVLGPVQQAPKVSPSLAVGLDLFQDPFALFATDGGKFPVRHYELFVVVPSLSALLCSAKEELLGYLGPRDVGLITTTVLLLRGCGETLESHDELDEFPSLVLLPRSGSLGALLSWDDGDVWWWVVVFCAVGRG